MDASPRIGVALALTAALLWGISGAIAADVFDEVTPARVAQVRALLTTIVLVPFAVYRRRLRPGPMLWWFALLGVNLAVVNVTFYWAVDLLGVGPGATIQFLGPIFVLVWMAVVERRPVVSAAWAAAAVAVAGVGLVSEAWMLDGSELAGFASGLASAVAFASYLVLGERIGRRAPVTTTATWGFIFASVIWLVAQPLWTFPTGLTTTAWVELLWVGIVGTAIPFLAEFAALQRVASGVVGVIATSEPVFGAAAAWVLLGQSLSAIQIAGGLMVVVAVAAIQRWGTGGAEVALESVR